MKNKNLLFKISIIIASVLILSIIILSLLGLKERVGYLSEFRLNIDKTLEINGLDIEETKTLFMIEDESSITNYIFTNDSITNYSYDFRIKYYSKVFRNSDIYGVYPNIDNILSNNGFIKEINIGESGSPFGNFISDKEFSSDNKIENINYTLKIKFDIYIYVILFLILFSICLLFKYFNYNIVDKLFDKKIITYIFFALIIILIIHFIIFVKLNYNNFANSDIASELILSNLLAKEHSILSKNFYYSTEIRVLHTQLIFTPLFYLFDSWHNVKLVGITLLLIILLISQAFLCKQLRLENVYSALFAIMILTPFSHEYFVIIMVHSQYIPHIFISFITLGLILLTTRLRNNFKYKKYFIILNCILCIIAILSGMGGLRQLLILYIPLFISSLYLFCIEKHIFFQNNNIIHIDTNDLTYFYIVFIESILILFASIIGYIINSTLLSKIYYFASYNNIRFTNFSLERLITVINGYFITFGFQAGEKIFSFSLLTNFMCFITIFILIISVIDILKNKIYSNEEKLLTLFFVVSNIIFCGLYSFSNHEYTERYSFPILIFAYLIIIIFIKHKIPILKTKNYYKIFAIVILILYLLSGSLIYFNPKYTAKNELVDVVNTLKDYGCHYGYATFWNGNVLTELSDGLLEIYHWSPDISTLTNVNEIYPWLQLVKHSTEIPSGKIFCIFRVDELGRPIAKSMEGSDILYKTDQYTVYIFESYDLMLSKVNTYFQIINNTDKS